jgi:predicted aspartyl protease
MHIDTPAQQGRWSAGKIVLYLMLLLMFVGVLLVSASILVYTVRLSSRPARKNIAPKSVVPPVTQQPVGQYHWQLDSDEPYDEVQVPFTYTCHELDVLLQYSGIVPNYGYICFDATVKGKKMRCVLDTGCASVTWPQKANLPGETITNLPSKGMKAINNSVRSAELVLLPNLNIGRYELSHLCTNKIKPDNKKRGVADTVAIVGNFALSSIVLTIDYRHKTLTFRNPTYNVQTLPKRKGDVLLDFAWQDGLPIVQGKLNGRPARFLVDTGSYAVCVTRQFAAKHLQKRKRTYFQSSGAFGSASGSSRLSKGVQAEVRTESGGYRFLASDIVGVPDDYDGIIGQPFLEFCDVTIDYPRQKILLHRNGLDCLPYGGLR